MMLPQDKLAEQIWLEIMRIGYGSKTKVEEWMLRCNLKYRKDKNYNDLVIAIGNGFKNTFGDSKKALEQLAEEIDKVLIIRRWN